MVEVYLVIIKLILLDLTEDISTLIQLMLGTARQQALTWANVEPGLCRRRGSLAYNELQFDMHDTST